MTDIEQLIRAGLKTDLESLELSPRPVLTSSRPRRRPAARVALVAACLVLLAVAVLVAVQRSDRLEPTPAPTPGRTWTRAADSPLSPRYFASMAWVGGRLFVGGGYDRGPCRGQGVECAILHPGLRDAALYDPTSNRWQPTKPAPAAIGSVVGVGEVVVAQTNDGMYVYDPREDRWTPIREIFRGFSIRTPERLASFGGRFYVGYGSGSFGTVEPVQECTLATHVCRTLPVDRHPFVQGTLFATGLGPVWVGRDAAVPLAPGPVVVDLLHGGRWQRFEVDEVKDLRLRVLDDDALVAYDGRGAARGILRLRSGQWVPVAPAPAAGGKASTGLRDLFEQGEGWAIGHGSIVGPDLGETQLGSPPGVEHRRNASTVIADDRLFVFGGYDGIEDRSSELWIRRLP